MNSNMYLAIEGHDALIVDPLESDTALTMLEKANVSRVTILLTHEHFDHISGANKYKRSFPSALICQESCAESIANAKNNRPIMVFMMMKAEEDGGDMRDFCDSLEVASVEADITFCSTRKLNWCGHAIKMTHCPGHSKGSCVIQFDDDVFFTGDYMIPDTDVILRFPGGSKSDFESITLPFLLAISDDAQIMPGHGTPYKRSEFAHKSYGLFARKMDYGA